MSASEQRECDDPVMNKSGLRKGIEGKTEQGRIGYKLIVRHISHGRINEIK